MASGVLGQYQLTSQNTWVSVYTTPTGITASAIEIMICNINSGATKVTMALSTQATTPLNSELIEYNATVSGFDVLERGGSVMEPGRKLFVYSSDPAVNYAVTVTGYEI